MTFQVPATITLTGFVRIEASSLDEARKDAALMDIEGVDEEDLECIEVSSVVHSCDTEEI